MRAIKVAGLVALPILSALAVVYLGNDEGHSKPLTRAGSLPIESSSGSSSLATLPLSGDGPRTERTVAASARIQATPLSTARTPVARMDPSLAEVTVVVRSDGDPIEGAVVLLEGLGDTVLTRDTVMDAQGRALTNEKGLASFELRPLSTWSGRAAFGDGACEASFLLTSPRAGQGRRVEVSLEGEPLSYSIEILVRSLPSGRPLAGATVATQVAGSSVALPKLAGRSLTTGRDGRVQVVLSPGSSLRIEALGHTQRSLQLTELELLRASRAFEKDGPPVPVPLPQLGRLWGSYGADLAGSVILVQQAWSGPNKPVPFPPRLSQPLDSHGYWEIRDLPTGITRSASPLKLQLSRRGNTQSLAADVQLGPGESREIPDPWQKATPIKSIVREDGHLLPAGTQLGLTYQAGPYPLVGKRLASAAVGLGGSWRSRSPMPHGTYRLQRLVWEGERLSIESPKTRPAPLQGRNSSKIESTTAIIRQGVRWPVIERRHAPIYVEFVHTEITREVRLDLLAH